MNKQPEALRLADWCDENSSGIYRPSAEAAAELRRLHAINAELLEALRGAHALAIGHAATYQFQHQLDAPHETHQAILDKASAAIAKAGEQP